MNKIFFILNDWLKKLFRNKLFRIGLFLLFVVLFWAMYKWDWTGFYYYVDATYDDPNGTAKIYRTFWDWLDLLIIPITVFGLGYWLDKREKEKTRKIEETQKGEDLLQDHLEQMTKLIIENELIDKPTQHKNNIATTRTKIILRSLNGEQKGRLLGFLKGVGLINKTNPIVNLENTDFSGSILFHLDLSNANLTKINLQKSNLSFTDFTGANLSGADIRSCVFDFGTLDKTNLKDAMRDAETSWISTGITDEQTASTKLTDTPIE